MRGGWRATGFVKSSDRNVPFGKQDLHLFPPERVIAPRLAGKVQTFSQIRDAFVPFGKQDLHLFPPERVIAPRLAGKVQTFSQIRDAFVPFGKQDRHAKHALDTGRATNDDADPGPAGGADQA